MDYDFITTCNWTTTGTYTLSAYRGSNTNVVTTHYASIHYRKKGTATWSTLNSSGQINITSTGEWEIGNDWNKSGYNVLYHGYFGITAINSCTDVYFNETTFGANCGGYFLYCCWVNCSNLVSMPSGFTIPQCITTVGGHYFLSSCWYGCSSLTSMPSGFNLPKKITGYVYNSFLANTWGYCSSLTSMPTWFNLPSGITQAPHEFLKGTWTCCSSLTSMPYAFNLPTGLSGSVGHYFLKVCWYDCTKLTSMPSGFNIPSGITSIGLDFLKQCWYNCTKLKADGDTENITFEFTATNAFGGTCPITPDSPAGTKTTPVNVAVNRIYPPFPYIRINIGDSWKTVTDVQINVGDSWKTVDMYSSEINIGDTWKSLST